MLGFGGAGILSISAPKECAPEGLPPQEAKGSLAPTEGSRQNGPYSFHSSFPDDLGIVLRSLSANFTLYQTVHLLVPLTQMMAW